MNKKKENIKLIVGILVVIAIFVSIWISKHLESLSDTVNLVNFESEYSHTVIDNFLDEVIDVNKINAKDIKIDNSNKVVGFTLSNDASYSFILIRNCLIDKGWEFVESGNSTSGSFYKNNGKYRWIFLNCINVGGESSIVLTSN